MEWIRDPERRQQMEYSTQLLGFTPDSLVDTIIGDASASVRRNLEAAKRKCAEAFDGKVDAGELDAAFESIESRCVEATERAFYKFGCYLRTNVLTVPPEVLLPGDELRAREEEPFNAGDLAAAEEKFSGLCQKVRNAKLERAMLRNKLAGLREVRRRQEAVIERAKKLAEEAKVARQLEKEVAALDEKTRQVEKAVGEMADGVEKRANEAKRRRIE